MLGRWTQRRGLARAHALPSLAQFEQAASFARLGQDVLARSMRAIEELRSWHRVGCDLLQFPQPETIMADKDLNALFLDTLKDIYYAEKQIYKSLPKMAKAANSNQLRAAFEKHHDETEGQIERLEKIFDLIDKPARGKKCDAIEGILDEGKEIMDEYADAPALDAGLLAAAQAVEHYEISRYGTLKAWAEKLGLKDAVKLLDQTLAEEKKTDDALSKIAVSAVNAEAA
jgi:ferritin-like metal-binding protein YciE